MLKKLTLVAFLLLAGCSQSSTKQGADGYTFNQKQYEKQTVQINVITYKTEEELVKAVTPRLKGTDIDPKTVAAFSDLKPPFDVCTIHMIDPKVRYEPEFVGHEFLHCVYGQWHVNNNTY